MYTSPYIVGYIPYLLIYIIYTLSFRETYRPFLGGLYTPHANNEKNLMYTSTERENTMSNVLQEADQIARQIQTPKRDNLVDIAGYAKCLEMIYETEERKSAS